MDDFAVAFGAFSVGVAVGALLVLVIVSWFGSK